MVEVILPDNNSHFRVTFMLTDILSKTQESSKYVCWSIFKGGHSPGACFEPYLANAVQ